MAEVLAKPSLTTDDRKLVLSMFEQGSPAVLFDHGMTADQVRKFLGREEVWAYMEVLRSETTEHAALQERTKFVAFRRLRYLAPTAMEIIEQALQGTIYSRNEKTGHINRSRRGHAIVKSFAPDEDQVAVAMDILDRLGVNKGAEYDPTRDGNLNAIMHRAAEPVQIPYQEGLHEDEKVLRRENMRLVIDRITLRFDEIKQKHKVKLKKHNRTSPADRKEPITPALRKIVKSKVRPGKPAAGKVK
jgi:hypothetical protein